MNRLDILSIFKADNLLTTGILRLSDEAIRYSFHYKTGRNNLEILKVILKKTVPAVIIISVVLFFYQAFLANWTTIRSYSLHLNFYFIALSFIAICLTYICTTYAWFVILNSLSNSVKITFPACVAIVNTSSLGKYFPGKVWSYAFQMYWLAQAGFSKSLVLYTNIITVVIILVTSLLLGVGYLVFFTTNVPATISSAAFMVLILLIVFDVAFIKYNSTIFNLLITVVNKVFKRDIKYFNISLKLLFYVHAINIFAAFCYGLGAYLVCLGIGFDVGPKNMFTVMSAMLISDVIGFLAIIVPGGLGVREGVMYFLLRGVPAGPLSLVLPIATRIVNMLVDFSLGAIGFVLLKKYSKLTNQRQAD
jgi:uncharacterized membrane protein YbhN (UPF0104 family)